MIVTCSHIAGKVLIIGGGIANFTNVAATFKVCTVHMYAYVYVQYVYVQYVRMCMYGMYVYVRYVRMCMYCMYVYVRYVCVCTVCIFLSAYSGGHNLTDIQFQHSNITYVCTVLAVCTRVFTVCSSSIVY